MHASDIDKETGKLQATPVNAQTYQGWYDHLVCLSVCLSACIPAGVNVDIDDQHDRLPLTGMCSG